MNTADFSVLPDELVVSLNPLRRSANRARAFCARMTGIAMPWTGAAAASRPRATGMPARWPFPPAPTPEEVSAGAPASLPAAGACVAAPAASAPTVARDQTIGDAKAQPAANQLTMKAMIMDVVLVLAWGAMIPGLMWLGVAGGF